MKDYYRLLRLDTNSGLDSIQRSIISYYEQVNQQHSDKILSDSAYLEAINILQEAQQVFNSKAKRWIYDNRLNNGGEIFFPDTQIQESYETINNTYVNKLKFLEIVKRILVLLVLVTSLVAIYYLLGREKLMATLALLLLVAGLCFIMTLFFKRYHFFQQGPIVRFLTLVILLVLILLIINPFISYSKLTQIDLKTVINLIIIAGLVWLMIYLTFNRLKFRFDLEYDQAIMGLVIRIVEMSDEKI